MIGKLHVMAFVVMLVFGFWAPAQTYTVLYSFTGGSDGSLPMASVIQDELGTLYGTTYEGGSYYGVVFSLTTAGTETALYSFTGGSDGRYPSTPVIRDNAGNLYGTTSNGGGCNYDVQGCGVVFKVDSTGTETVLHTFQGGKQDGCYPDQGLTMDASGNLYGTTEGCASIAGWGEIFKIDTAGKYTILHRFAGAPYDGGAPAGGHLLVDSTGDLYGLTSSGGGSGCGYRGCGVLYKLTPNGKLTMLHRFAGGTRDGCGPQGRVVEKAGNFYGTTNDCGSFGYGTVWKVSYKGKETILHNFAGGASDGEYPSGGVAVDSDGNIYGDTYWGGANQCSGSGCGVLYELSSTGTFTVLHSFGNGSDGYLPSGEVLHQQSGQIYGTTTYGSSKGPGAGTVWEYVP